MTAHTTAGLAPAPAGQALGVHQVTSGAMADRAVALLRDRLDAGVAPTQLAVLARVNSALLPVQVALADAGIPSTAPLDTTVLGRTGIRTALAYLRLGLDPDAMRRDDVLETLNRPTRKVKSAVAPMLRRSRTWSMRQLEQVADALDGTAQERFRGYLGDLHHLAAALADGADTGRALWIVRNRIGLDEAMDALDASRTRPEGSSHGDDLDALEQLAARQPAPDQFRDWLLDHLRVPADPAGVTLSTVHRVKGMEWPDVIVFAANRGLFPHRLSVAASGGREGGDVEEERRIFHVAITRCQRRVDIIADRDRPSPFVAELTTPPPPTRRADDREAATARGPVRARRRPDGAVHADVGLQVTLPGGFAATVVEAGGGLVRLRLGGDVEVRVPYDSPVTVDGDRTRLVDPRAGRAPTLLGAAGDDDPVDEALFEALRSWRARVAAEQGVPAYLVFHDRHLRTIAARRPASARELAACPGVGPTKLERYGDDLLALLDRH